MLKLEVTKTIEARTLNKRTRQMLAQPPVTLPYGAILSDVVENRDVMEFSYMGELYNCKSEVLRAASHSLDDSAGSPAGAAPASLEAQITFRWEKLNAGTIPTFRAKVPAGWLILVGETSSRGVTFYPDADHEWDGTTS
jgi:hypothetical protein